jgi:hypothetical protein
MGCIVSEQEHFRLLKTIEVVNAINEQYHCWICKQSILYSYELIEECTKCHTIWHVSCTYETPRCVVCTRTRL